MTFTVKRFKSAPSVIFVQFPPPSPVITLPRKQRFPKPIGPNGQVCPIHSSLRGMNFKVV